MIAADTLAVVFAAAGATGALAAIPHVLAHVALHRRCGTIPRLLRHRRPRFDPRDVSVGRVLSPVNKEPHED
jgi:hypothetical protein